MDTVTLCCEDCGGLYTRRKGVRASKYCAEHRAERTRRQARRRNRINQAKRRETPEGQEENRRLAGESRRRARERFAQEHPRLPGPGWASKMKREFGLSPEDVERMLDDQDGACGICRVPFDAPGSAPMHVDHDHETGGVRGVLCGECNLGLGKFRDDPARLTEAVRWLKPREAFDDPTIRSPFEEG